MRQIAFREALREAMQEEMRRDERVFLMGEEVAEYNGAYKVSQGMLEIYYRRNIKQRRAHQRKVSGYPSGTGLSGLS